jgi:ATP-binding cassette subfamily B protein
MVAALRTPQSFRERIGAWRHLPTFVHLVWDASPTLTLASFALRLARSVVPVLVLYVSKLIFDAVVAEARLPHPGWSPAEWIESGRLIRVGWLVTLELGLAVMADFSGRLSSLFDSLLAETYSNFASIRLMERRRRSISSSSRATTSKINSIARDGRSPGELHCSARSSVKSRISSLHSLS